MKQAEMSNTQEGGNVSLDREAPSVELDTSDVDRWIGKRVIFAEMWDPCNATDIRRWVQALDYANPIHWDREFAKGTKFEGLIAPQSFVVNMDYGHGCHPACVGKIPGSHLIFAGEEWWFYGDHISPGDHLTQERYFDGYTVSDTAFAGPTMFTRGDTIHTIQDGKLIAKERATAIRYLVEEAKKRAQYDKVNRAPKKWTHHELLEINQVRLEWIKSNREGLSPRFSTVQVGDVLPSRVMGPHSKVTFANECRAFRQNIWGTWGWNVPEGTHDPALEDAGFAENMTYDHAASKIDPREHDGLYRGPSSGHVNDDKAEQVGMGGSYGYGAAMNAWHLDTIAYWAGHDGYIWHSKTQFSSPAFEGDVTWIEGKVIEKLPESEWGPVVRVEIVMTTQDGNVILKGTAEVGLPA